MENLAGVVADTDADWSCEVSRLLLHMATASVLASTAQAQQSPDTVDAIVVGEGLARGVPGLAVVVVSAGRVVVKRGYGVADVTTGRQVTTGTPFNIASVTKPFTAAVILQLVREGRVELDAAASGYLPLPEIYRRITVRQLLTHTSGIARDLRTDNLDDPDAGEYRRRLDASRASSEPGTQYEYSNTGYTVLGMLIEAVEQQPLAQVFRSRLFVPLAMPHADYRPSLTTVSERARPHVLVDGTPQLMSVALTGGFGSGGLVLAADDAAAFALALQEGRVLTAAEQLVAWAPGRLANGAQPTVRIYADGDGYGFGWILSQFQGHRLITHGGGIDGHSANLYHFPEEQLTIIVIANVRNRNDGRTPVDPIARQLAELYLSTTGSRQ